MISKIKIDMIEHQINNSGRKIARLAISLDVPIDLAEVIGAYVIAHSDDIANLWVQDTDRALVACGICESMVARQDAWLSDKFLYTCGKEECYNRRDEKV